MSKTYAFPILFIENNTCHLSTKPIWQKYIKFTFLLLLWGVCFKLMLMHFIHKSIAAWRVWWQISSCRWKRLNSYKQIVINKIQWVKQRPALFFFFNCGSSKGHLNLKAIHYNIYPLPQSAQKLNCCIQCLWIKSLKKDPLKLPSLWIYK